MAADLVLITGATGHIGGRVLREALEHGYHVRAAVRSEAKAKSLLASAVVQATMKGANLSFTIVPDILILGAFDQALEGVKYVNHLASPIPSAKEVPPEQHFSQFIEPAVQGTLGVLQSAQNSRNVEKVVVTSSVVAIVPLNAMFMAEDGKTYDAQSRVRDTEGPYPNPTVAYTASKIAAFNAAESWINYEKPSFDVVHVHPSFVIGRDELVDNVESFKKGTNWYAMSIIMGERTTAPKPSNTVHVDDVARVHVAALNPQVKGCQSFVTSSDGLMGHPWNDAKDIAARLFPKQVEDGTFPNNGEMPTITTKIDYSKTEDKFGFVHKKYEEQVKDIAEHYLEIIGKA